MAAVVVDSGNETLLSDSSSEMASPPASRPPRPPRIQPFSGFMGNGKVVIRPVAFRAGEATGVGNTRLRNAGERYGSTPALHSRPGSHMALYHSSSDLRHNSLSVPRRGTSHTPSAPHTPQLSSLPAITPLTNNRHGNGNSGGKLTYANGGGSLLNLAPSPSDSGVSELEAALRDRDSELHHLKNTNMEYNDQGIFSDQTRYNEKERVWERELRRLKAVHESRLRAGAQKAIKLEQLLMMQSYQLQQDKLRLTSDAELATRQAGECRHEAELATRQAEECRHEAQQLQARLEDTEWNLCQKTGEISLLKTQLKDAQNEQTAKGHEYLQLKGELKITRENLERREKEISRLQKDNEEKDKSLKQLQLEVTRLNSNLKDMEANNLKSKEQSNREIERLKTDLKELREELSDVSLIGYEGIESGRSMRGIYDICKNSNEYHWNSNDSSLEDAEVQRLNGELPDAACNDICQNGVVERLKCQLQSKESEFDQERRKWSEEKEKVLRYQEQLQLSYVAIIRRERSLQKEMDALRREMSNKSVNSVANLGKTIEL